MNKLFTAPAGAWDTLFETLSMDTRAENFDPNLRREIAEAFSKLKEVRLAKARTFTVYAFASDTHDNGTQVEMFASQAEVHQARRQIILHAIEGTTGADAQEIRECLEAGQLSDAWDLFEDSGFRDALNTYHEEEKTFTIPPEPIKKVRVEVRGGVAHLVHCPRGVEVTIKDYDMKGHQ